MHGECLEGTRGLDSHTDSTHQSGLEDSRPLDNTVTGQITGFLSQLSVTVTLEGALVPPPF